MSIQTGRLPSRSAFSQMRSRLRWHCSASRSSPSWVGLDGNLRVESGRFHLVEHVEVMLGDPLGFVELRDPLAQPRQDRVDALRLQHARGLQRVFDFLPGHETRIPTSGRTNAWSPVPAGTATWTSPGATFRITDIRARS
jgi:hypothetical protein